MSINACDDNILREYEKYNKYSSSDNLKLKDCEENFRAHLVDFTTDKKIDPKKLEKFIEAEYGIFGKIFFEGVKKEGNGPNASLRNKNLNETEYQSISETLDNFNSVVLKDPANAGIFNEHSNLFTRESIENDFLVTQYGARIYNIIVSCGEYLLQKEQGTSQLQTTGPSNQVYKNLYDKGISREDFCKIRQVFKN